MIGLCAVISQKEIGIVTDNEQRHNQHNLYIRLRGCMFTTKTPPSPRTFTMSIECRRGLNKFGPDDEIWQDYHGRHKLI